MKILVKKYKPRTGKPLTPQYQEILNWFDKNKNYDDSYIFVEFTPPGFKERQIDFLVITSTSFTLIEVKNNVFTKIFTNKLWLHLTEEKEEELLKYVGGNFENPYDQATNTGDALVKWLRKNSHIFYDTEFKKFINSESFKVYPVVFINNNNLLNEKSIEYHSWCKLAIGLEKLEENVQRSWRPIENYRPIITNEEIENLAGVFGLEKLSKSQQSAPGRENETLIPILDYLVKEKQISFSEKEIKDKIFDQGEIRMDQVRRAIKRGLGDHLIEKKGNFYTLNEIIILLLNEGLSIQRIYNDRSILRTFEKLISGYPVIFNVFTQKLTNSEGKVINQRADLSLKTVLYLPAGLQIFNIEKVLEKNNSGKPQFFRPTGPILIDFNANFITKFIDNQNQDIENIINDILLEKKKLLVIGSSFIGKTTLVKSIAINFMNNGYSVLYLTPTDLDNEAINALSDFDKDSDTKLKLLIIIENLHLATATELTWLDSILLLKKIIFIVTSRKETILLNNTDFILNNFTNDDCVLNLNEVLNFEDLNHNLLLNFFSKQMPAMSNETLTAIVNRIQERNENVLILIEQELKSIYKEIRPNLEFNKGIEILLLENIEQQKTVKLFLDLSDEDVLKKKFKFLQSIVERNVQNLNSLSNIDLKILRKILIIIYEMCYLEIPVRAELISEIINIDVITIDRVLILLENIGELIELESNFYIYHPELANQILMALEDDKENWNEIFENYLDETEELDFANNEDDFSTRLKRHIYNIDPTIQIDWTNEQDEGETEESIAIPSKMTIDKIIELSREVTAENFLNLFNSYKYEYVYLNEIDSLNDVWEQIGIEELKSLIESAETFYGFFRLLDEIFITGWSKFQKLLVTLNLERIHNIINNGGYLSELKTYCKRWNWKVYPVIEVQYTLKRIFAESGNLYDIYEISEQAFNIINEISIDTIFEKVRALQPYDLRIFLDFLHNSEKKFGKSSKIRIFVILIILKDSASVFSCEQYCNLLQHLLNSGEEEKFDFVLKLINKDRIYEQLKELGRRWLEFYIKITMGIRLVELNEVIELFSVNDILELMDRFESVKEGEDYHWIYLLIALGAFKWNKMSNLLDSLPIDEFVELLENKPKEMFFSINDLLEILLSNTWSNKQTLLNNLNISELLSNISIFEVGTIVDTLVKYSLPNISDYVRNYYVNCLSESNDWELGRILELANKHSWDWKEWTDSAIIGIINENNYPKMTFIIELLKRKGWNVLDPIVQQMEEIENSFKRSYINRLSLLDKASYLVSNQDTFLEGVKCYEEFVANVNEQTGIEELTDFFERISKLNVEIKEKLLSKISPEILLNAINQKREGYRPNVILDYILKLPYKQTSVLIEMYLEKAPINTYDSFWREFPGIDKGIVKVIIKEFMNKGLYSRLVRIPTTYKELFYDFREELKVKIISEAEIDPLVLALIEYGLKSEEEKTSVKQEIIENLLTRCQYEKVLIIFKQKKDYLEITLNKLKERNFKDLKLMIEGIDLLELNLLLMNIEEIDINYPDEIIKLSTEEEWKNILSNKETMEKFIIKSWVKRVYTNFGSDSKDEEEFDLNIVNKFL